MGKGLLLCIEIKKYTIFFVKFDKDTAGRYFLPRIRSRAAAV